MTKELALIGMSIVLAIATFFAFAGDARAQEAPFPSLTGNYNIGQVEWTFADASRKEPVIDENTTCIDPNKSRSIPTVIYYPAEDSSGDAAKYLPPSLIEAYGLGGAGIELLHKRAVANAPMSNAAETFPLVIFSPGLGISSPFYTALLEEIASHGYIVVGVSHPYMSGEVYNPNNDCVIATVPFPTDQEEIVPWLSDMISVNLLDFNYLIAELQRLNSTSNSELFDDLFYARINFSKMVMMGHSGGGMSVTAYCIQQQLDCRAGINLDGGNYSGEGVDRSSAWPAARPDLTYLKIRSASFPGIDIIPAAAFGEDQYLVDIAKIDHQTFSDKAYFGLVNAETPEGEKVLPVEISHKLIGEHILSFLTMATSSTDQEIVWPNNSEYVTIRGVE